jgi:hypothetical protein
MGILMIYFTQINNLPIARLLGQFTIYSAIPIVVLLIVLMIVYIFKTKKTQKTTNTTTEYNLKKDSKVHYIGFLFNRYCQIFSTLYRSINTKKYRANGDYSQNETNCTNDFNPISSNPVHIKGIISKLRKRTTTKNDYNPLHCLIHDSYSPCFKLRDICICRYIA